MSSDHHVYAREGDTIDLPSPLTDPVQVIYYPSGRVEGGLTINLYHPYYLLTMAATFTTTNKTTGEVLLQRSFVTADSPTGVIRLPEALFDVDGNAEVSISISNSEAKTLDNRIRPELDSEYTMQFQITSGTLTKVDDDYPVYSSVGRRGMFKYFLYTRQKSDTSFFYLRVESGEADLYISRSGEKNDKFPDINTYEFSSASIRNDEIMILPTSKAEGEAKKTENFVIGVYCVTDSVFTLQVSTNPMYRYAQIEPGQVITQKLDMDYPMLVTMMNPSLKNFRITAYGKTGGVTVFGKPVDETKIFNFIDMVPDFGHDKPLIDTKVANMIEKVDAPKPTSQDLNQWAFLIRPTKADEVTFFIEMDQRPLQVPIGSGFFDLLGNQECQSYRFAYGSEIFDEKLKLSVEQGSVRFMIGDEDPATTPVGAGGAITIESKGQLVSQKVQLSKVLGGKDNKTATPDAFSNFYVRACSRTNLSLFQLKTYKPSSHYFALNPSDRVTIDSKDESTLYYYYADEPSTEIRVKVLLRASDSIDQFITTPEEAGATLKFYHVTNEGFGLAGSKGFTANDPSGLVQADVSTTVHKQGNVNAVIYSYQAPKGYFIIKPAKIQSSRHLVRIQFSINNNRRIASSGSTFESIEAGKTYRFQINKMSTDSTSLSISSCRGEVIVDVFEGLTDSPKSSFKIGNNQEFEGDKPQKHMNLFDNKVAVENFMSQASVIFIEVRTTYKEGPPALVVFKVKTYRVDEYLGIEDYFSQYTTKFALFSEPLYTITKQADSYSISIRPIQPAVNFDLAYKNFDRVEISYLLHTTTRGFPIDTRAAIDSKCAIDNTDTRRRGDGLVIASQTIEKKAVHGIFQWDSSPKLFSDIPFPFGPAPYSAILQIKLTFFGEDDESEDDDATILIKQMFSIEDPENTGPLEPIKIFKAAVLLTLLFGIIICACVFWVNRNRAAGPTSGKAFQQVTKSETEMNQLKFENRPDSKIETTVTETKQSDPDETV